MNFEELRMDESFHKWKDYAPKEVQYLKFAESEPSVIAAGHKIEDVYFAFSYARASLLYSHVDDFGELVGKDSNSRLYARTHFLNNAVLEYALCLDLSWQVIWAYVQPASLEYLLKQEFSKMSKECTRDNIINQLKCIISQHSVGVAKAQRLIDVVCEFDKSENTLHLRRLYNMLKHQGTIHYEGLGSNPVEMMVAVQGKCPPMLHRMSYKPEEIEEMLFKYHDTFKSYMDTIIEVIFPSEYLVNEISPSEALASLINIRQAMD
jgi:hypothetical protein